MTSLKERIRQDKGFTLIEMLIVTLIIAMLGSIAFINFKTFRSKAYDAVARTDARNFVDSLVTATLNGEDVLYQPGAPGDVVTGQIGNLDTGLNPRSPVFTLSEGVEAIIVEIAGNTVNVDAVVYHTRGSGKTFNCGVDEGAGSTYLIQ